MNSCEAWLTPFFTDADLRLGYLHSKFSRAINFSVPAAAGPDRLLTLMRAGLPAIPDSLMLPDSVFAQVHRLPIQTEIVCRGLSFEVPDAGIRLQVPMNQIGQCSLKSRHEEITGQHQLNFDNFRSAYRQFIAQNRFQFGFASNPNLAEISRLALTGQSEALKNTMAKIIGLGQGLTPACDDALIGILAMLTCVKCSITSLISEDDWLRLIHSRTTDISIKYLRCAYAGYFSEPIVQLADQLFSAQPQNWQPLFELFSKIGGSSGLDMLYGIDLTVNALMTTARQDGKP
ncbi:MAG TPA: hypothetical protein DCM45_05020 [Clostridiales bacterium]|nr:hypothetical protein [Clostridiales bacterium]